MSISSYVVHSTKETVNMYCCFSVSNKLMKYFGKNDLGRRIGPRLDAFQSIGSDAVTTGVMYWIKTYLFRDYCEAKNGYVCQRPAAAGAASEANGKNIKTKSHIFINN